MKSHNPIYMSVLDFCFQIPKVSMTLLGFCVQKRAFNECLLKVKPGQTSTNSALTSFQITEVSPWSKIHQLKASTSDSRHALLIIMR